MEKNVTIDGMGRIVAICKNWLNLKSKRHLNILRDFFSFLHWLLEQFWTLLLTPWPIQVSPKRIMKTHEKWAHLWTLFLFPFLFLYNSNSVGKRNVNHSGQCHRFVWKIILPRFPIASSWTPFYMLYSHLFLNISSNGHRNGCQCGEYNDVSVECDRR